jgi:hypothetical protein
MKKKITLFMFLITNLCGYTQSAYYDAQILKGFINPITGKIEAQNPEQSKIIKGIFDNYKYNRSDNSNPFLDPFFDLGSAASLSASGVYGKLASSVSGLNVTSFADGLAQFLVERTKEELNVAFFQKLKNLLDQYPEFTILFPNTKILISNFESWQYASLINTLRESFDKDFKEILENLIKLRNIQPSDCPDKSNTCKARVTEVRKFFGSNEGLLVLSALQIGKGLNQNNKVPDVINSIVAKDFLLGYKNSNPQVESDFINSLKLINILSLSIKSNQINQHYISQTELNSLMTDATLQKIYLGLVFQQISKEAIVISQKFVAAIIINANGLINYLTQIHTQSISLQTSYNTLLSNKIAGRASFADNIVVFEMTNLLFEAIGRIDLIDTSLSMPEKAKEVFGFSKTVTQIVHDINIRNYNASIVGILRFIDEKIDHANDPEMEEFIASFLNYASFAANVVNAKDSKEVKEAIKSVAQPSGSSSIKKHSNFNVSLNAYVGFVYGRDVPSKGGYTITDANGVKSTVKLNGGHALAVWAPVGISISKGMLFSRRNPWSISALLSVIDVGALVGYRFTNDSTSSPSTEVKLANIFAPGGNIVIGLPSVPISIGYGFQWIPSLQRNPGDNSLYSVDYSGMRQHQIFIAVDIPLINFHTGKKHMLSSRKR